jgi:hypothetical protein
MIENLQIPYAEGDLVLRNLHFVLYVIETAIVLLFVGSIVKILDNLVLDERGETHKNKFVIDSIIDKLGEDEDYKN